MTRYPIAALRRAALALTFVSVVFISTSTAAADGLPAQDASQSEGFWISVGQDAFERLQGDSSLGFDHRPLQAVAEHRGVVVTRIRPQDAPVISRIIHQDFHRCSGFIVHDSEEEARQAVDMAFTSQLLGSPIDYVMDQSELVNDVQAQVLALNIRDTIESLSEDFSNRFHTHPSAVAASNWVRDLWQGYAASRPDVTVELYDHSGWAQPSVVLTIPGAWNADEVIVLGGHIDSVNWQANTGDPNFFGPGADDNASGIAALSEIIRVLLANDFRPQRTVQFMAYAAEEVGLLGSGELAEQAVVDGDDVVAVLQLDMIAFNGSNEDISLIGDFTNSQLNAFVGDLIDVYQPDLQWTTSLCGYGCSDHASWHNRGFPAAMPFEARFGQHNSAIHTAGDTLATLNNSAAHAAKFARLGTAFAIEIGLDDLGEMFRDGFESGDLARWATAVGSETGEP